MADTNFVTDVTVIEADWLNDANYAAYGTADGTALPVDDDITQILLGPNITSNVFQESGETTWFSQHTLRHARQSAHITDAYSVFSIESRPVGSTGGGPTNADYGQTISIIKNDFFNTSVQGEIDGISIVVRQGGQAGGTANDCAGILINAQIVQDSGFLAAIECKSTSIDKSTAALINNMQAQIGVLTDATTTHIGFFAAAQAGSLTDGCRISEQGTGTWTNFFRGQNAAGTVLFKVVSSGEIVGQELTLEAAATAATGNNITFGKSTAATATAGAATLPANPTGFLEFYIGTTKYKLPYYPD